MAIEIASRRTSSKVISSRNSPGVSVPSPGSVNPLAVPFSVNGLEATTLGGVVEELAESISPPPNILDFISSLDAAIT